MMDEIKKIIKRHIYILARKNERKKLIRAQSLLGCVQARYQQKDHGETLPTMPLKAAFGCTRYDATHIKNFKK
jgi:hypothetical protein